QGHFRLLSSDDRRIDEALLRSLHEHAGDDRADGDNRHVVPDDELSDVTRRAAPRDADGAGAAGMITVTNLVKRYGGNEILKGISLEIRKGEVHSIIGPSGGGKSTFLRCLNGLEGFQQGEVRVDGHLLTPSTNSRTDARLLEAVRRKVGFVFQQF